MRPGSAQRRAAWAVWLAVSAGGPLALPASGHAESVGVAAPSVHAGGVAESPLTVVVTRNVRPGCEARFEALIHDTFQSGDPVAGRISTEFLRPAEPNSHAYTVIYRFDRVSQYGQWLQSPERAVWLDRSAQLVDGPPQFQYRSGLEVWVTPPDEPGYRAPQPYKTMVLNFLTIYPVTIILTTALAPVTVGWSPLAATALRTGIMVSAVGYGVMPYVSSVFREWLFPPVTECRAG